MTLQPQFNGNSIPTQNTDLLASVRNAKDDKRLAQWVRSEYGSMRAARSQVQNQWNLNLAFYYGNQYLEYDRVITGKLVTPKAPRHRVRLTVNRIQPLIRTELSRLTQQKPNASVIPATAEDEDLAAAYAAEQVWESINRNNKVPRVFRDAAWWTCLTGVGFVKQWWDSSKGDVHPDTGQPIGDIAYSSVTPYHIFVPDLRTTALQEQPYVLNVYTRSVEYVKRMYGARVENINVVPDVVSSNEIIGDATLNLSGGRTEADSVLCFEMWIKPGANKMLPNGGLVHVIGDEVVYAARDGLPYGHGEFPFTKIDHIPTGKFYSESVINQIIPLQREYNRTRSQIVEAKNRMGKPQLLVARGSVDPRKITTEPGLAIEYRPGLPPPTPIVPVPLPAYIIQEQDRVLGDIEDITGQHQVSRGEAPSGVTAATAISFLQEKDDGILAHTYASIEEAWENIAYQTLNLVVQYWDTQRLIKTVGTDGAFDTLLLTGSDLKNSTDIRMEGGSALPVSKAARQAFIMDLMKMGFIDPKDGMKLLDMGGVTKIFEALRLDESAAQRENIKLKKMDPEVLKQWQQAQVQLRQQQMQEAQQTEMSGTMGPDGMPIPGTEQVDPMGAPMEPTIPTPLPMESIISVNSWDNHQVHIEVHNAFRKSQSFELLDDSIKAEFESHVNAHLMAASAAMMQAQQMSGGGMGGEPGVEGPMGPEGPGANPKSDPSQIEEAPEEEGAGPSGSVG